MLYMISMMIMMTASGHIIVVTMTTTMMMIKYACVNDKRSLCYWLVCCSCCLRS